jgi:hypothetical protein
VTTSETGTWAVDPVTQGAETPEDFGLSDGLWVALQELNDAWQNERLLGEGMELS